MIEHPDIAKERSTLMQLEEACNRLINENDKLKKVLKDFVAKVESGRAQSTDTYNKAKTALRECGELELK